MPDEAGPKFGLLFRDRIPKQSRTSYQATSAQRGPGGKATIQACSRGQVGCTLCTASVRSVPTRSVISVTTGPITASAVRATHQGQAAPAARPRGTRRSRSGRSRRGWRGRAGSPRRRPPGSVASRRIGSVTGRFAALRDLQQAAAARLGRAPRSCRSRAGRRAADCSRCWCGAPPSAPPSSTCARVLLERSRCGGQALLAQPWRQQQHLELDVEGALRAGRPRRSR